MTVAAVLLSFVAKPGFYPGRKVEAPNVDRWTPLMDRQLKPVGARLEGRRAIACAELLRACQGLEL